jgi:type IV secretion system protein TrbL
LIWLKHLSRYRITLALIVTLWIIGASEASAAIEANNAIERIINLYRDNVQAWQTSLTSYAVSLFWILAGIEFVWTAIRLTLKGAEMNDFLAELVNRILFIGFFYTLLLHSAEWTGAIVQSFREAANSASSAAGGSSGISPANIIDNAIIIVSKLLQSTTILNPADALVSGISAIVILGCFALMAASLIEALIESYIVLSAGVIFMGFGGSSWTSEYAKKILIYAVSVGAKLFVIQLIMGLGETLIEQLATEFDGSRIEDVLVMVGVSVVMFVICRNIPQIVQGLVNGTSFGSGNTLSAAVSAGVAAGIAAVAGGGYSAAGAAKLASEQLKAEDANGTAPESKLARAAAWTGKAVKNLGQASIEDVGGRLSGRPSHGTMGGRMGRSMTYKAKDLAAERQKPKEPVGTAHSTNGTQPGNIIRPQ